MLSETMTRAKTKQLFSLDAYMVIYKLIIFIH